MAASVVAQKGQGAQLAKIDIKSDYPMLSVHPDNHWLLGMQWDGMLFIDTALPFGLRSAPKIFTAVTDTIKWMVKQEGVYSIMHYLDDFLLIGSLGGRDCARSLSTCLMMFDYLGVPNTWDKLEGPMMVLTFLDIEIDTQTMQLQLLVTVWRDKRSCKRKEFELLIGKLQHACIVVKPGRTFL